MSRSSRRRRSSASSSYQFIFAEPDFHRAFVTSLALAAGMTAIAVPAGGVLAFLVVRTDLPGKGALEPLLLVPIVLSPIVLAFGYVVAVGPVGFASLAFKSLLGFVPWNLYSLSSLIVIAGSLACAARLSVLLRLAA